MKKISVQIPCYNEEENVVPMAETLTGILQGLEKYDYELVFRNNGSKDHTMERLRELAQKDKHIKVIDNCRNYGLSSAKDTFVGRVSGDVIISIPCDFQEPPELIPEFISWWEKGYEVVAGQKTSSKEGKIKYGIRQIYYKIIGVFSDVPQVPNMSGIMLYSRRILEMFWKSDRNQYFRYFITDLGCDIKLIQYEQQKRRSGKSSYNIWKSLAFSINSMVMTSTAPLRIATVVGVILSFCSFLIGLVYLICKLIWWDRFSAGTAPILIGMFFVGAIQLMFIGILGEYIGTILKKVSKPTPPIVKELINFDGEDDYLFPSPQEEN